MVYPNEVLVYQFRTEFIDDYYYIWTSAGFKHTTNLLYMPKQI